MGVLDWGGDCQMGIRDSFGGKCVAFH